MNHELACCALTNALSRRLAGAALILIAVFQVVLEGAGSSLSPGDGAVLLLVVLVIIGFAVHKTPGGATSLIGLFYLGTILWVAPRPIFALATEDDSIYTLYFGELTAPRGEDLSRLLAFWAIGIACVFGGYFLLFRDTRRSMPPLSQGSEAYLKRSFAIAFAATAALIPFLAYKRFLAFATGGYLALYLNQAESSFSLVFLLEYLIPTLFALAVLIDENRYGRLMVAAVTCYALCGILFGRRMEAGTWLLIALWHHGVIRGKPVRLGRLVMLFAVLGCGFQWVEVLRTGTDPEYSILTSFFVSQGIILMIPSLAWQLSSPPLYTVAGSLLSMRHIYRFFDIGSIGTANLIDYISSQGSPVLFQSGNGLSTTAYLDIFFLCGQATVFYAVACLLLGVLLRKWEEGSSRSHIALFFLCASLPAILFCQRSSVLSVTSPAVYISLFMAAAYLLHLFISFIRINAVHAERAHGVT